MKKDSLHEQHIVNNSLRSSKFTVDLQHFFLQKYHKTQATTFECQNDLSQYKNGKVNSKKVNNLGLVNMKK